MSKESCYDRLIRFDSIRLFKLLEIVYYTIISFIITALFANLLENKNLFPYIFKHYDYEKHGIGYLLKDIIVDLSILTIFIYYLKKFLSCIPFIFSSLNKKYKPSMKDEVTVGIVLGTGIILYKSLTSITHKLKPFNIKLKEYIDNILNKLKEK